MRKISLFILAIFTTVATAFAQQKGKVSFVLVDAVSKQAVIGAVVEVYPTAKPENKRHYTSNVDGSVNLPSLEYGEYAILATCLGYDDLNKTITIKSATQNLGKIEMKESTTRIDTVVKEVKSLRASQSGDTLSYNAGAFKVSADSDVEGLLKKMPGINISNGSVEAQGETVKKVYVDGKEFFGDDVSAAIKSLPAEAVDRVEVFNKLSDQAEFSGMDDGEGYKALNIVTKSNMRQGQFGKVYAGYGYQPETDDITSHHKYTVGGNVNFFQGDSRVSLIGLFNNINQQNFSFEDILGVSDGGGGGRRGFGQYMVRPQSGVAAVNSIGVNYSDQWGRKDQVKFQGSYFFNNTNTNNLSMSDTWYEDPSPVDTLHKEGRSHTLNNNHRVNARLDWKISRNQSLMSRISFSFQGNNPESTTAGYKFGQSGLLYQFDRTIREGRGYNFSEFLQYRVKLGKPGRTMTIDGDFRYRNNNNTRKLTSNESSGVAYGSEEYNDLYADYVTSGNWKAMNGSSALYSPVYQMITAPTREYNVRGNLTYNEPLSQNSSLSLQYRLSYEDELKDQEAFYFSSDAFDPSSKTINQQMTSKYESGYWTHRVGPGYRYSKNRNTIVANVFYQYSELEGKIAGGQNDDISKKFHNFIYFGMINYAFNKENSIRVFLRSSTNSPSVTQLQSIFDVSNPQYLSIGNKDLDPSFSHNFNFHYIHSNIEKGRTFMWMFSASNQQNYISSSTLYCPTGFELSKFGEDVNMPTNSKGEYYRPQRITSYENLDGFWNLRTHISLGLPLSFMKCNLNMSGGVSYSIVPSAIYNTSGENVVDNILNHNFTTNYAKNIGYNAAVTLGSNISENIDFTFSWHGTYNQAWNTASKAGAKNDYFNHVASGSLKWVFWKGFTFTAACSYNQYIGITQDYNEQFVLCNLYLGKKIFKNKRGEIQIGVNDIANQNTAFSRSTGSGYTQNSTNSVIGRYYSIQFVYNLRHFGKKGSKQMADYNYREGKSSVGMGAGGNMGPMMRR